MNPLEPRASRRAGGVPATDNLSPPQKALIRPPPPRMNFDEHAGGGSDDRTDIRGFKTRQESRDHLQTWVKMTLIDEHTPPLMNRSKSREPRVERPPRDVSLRRTSWLTPRRRATRAVDPLRPRPRAPIVSLGPKDRRVGPRAVAGRPWRRERGRRVEALLFSRRPSETPTARERRRPRRADANMTKVPRRDVSDADREGSIRAAAPGARAFPTRSVLSPVSRSDARWLAREKNARVTTRDSALTPPFPILLDADTSGDSSDTIFAASLTDDAAWPPPSGRAKVRAHSASEYTRRDLARRAV